MQLPTAILEIKGELPKGTQYKLGQQIEDVSFVNIFKKENKDNFRACFWSEQEESFKTIVLSERVESFARYWAQKGTNRLDYLVVPTKVTWNTTFKGEGFILEECVEIEDLKLPYRPFAEWSKISGNSKPRVSNINGKLQLIEAGGEQSERWVLNRMGGLKPFYWDRPFESTDEVINWFFDPKQFPSWVLMEKFLLSQGCGDGLDQRLYNFAESAGRTGLAPINDQNIDDLVEALLEAAIIKSK